MSYDVIVPTLNVFVTRCRDYPTASPTAACQGRWRNSVSRKRNSCVDSILQIA